MAQSIFHVVLVSLSLGRAGGWQVLHNFFSGRALADRRAIAPALSQWPYYSSVLLLRV